MNNLSKILSYSTLGTFFAFLLQIISTKILSVYDYGIIAKWLTDLAFLSIFFLFGLDNSLLFYSKNNKNDYNKNFFVNLTFFSSLCAVLLIIAFLMSSLYYTLLILCIYILSIIQSINSYNQLNENFNKYGLVNLSKTLFLFVFFSLVLLFDFKFNSLQYLYSYFGILFLTLFFVILISCKSSLKFNKIYFHHLFNKEYFLYGSKSMMNTFLAISLYSLTIYFLDYYETKKEVALFFAASTISKLAWVVPDAVGNVLYPKYLKINIKYKKEDVFNETFFYAQLNFLLNIFAIFLFFLFGNFFISLIYNPDYLEIFYLVLILLIGNQGMVYYKILGRYLASINEWRIQRIALIFAVLCNIILNILLTKSLGLVGAAISTALAFWTCGLIVAFSVKGSFLEFINLKSFIRKILSDK